MGAPGVGYQRPKGSTRQDTSLGGRQGCWDAFEFHAGAKDQLEQLVL